MTAIALIQVTVIFTFGLLTHCSASTMLSFPHLYIIHSSYSNQIDLWTVKIRLCHPSTSDSFVAFHFTYNNLHCLPCLQESTWSCHDSFLSLRSQIHSSLYPSRVNVFLFLERLHSVLAQAVVLADPFAWNRPCPRSSPTRLLLLFWSWSNVIRKRLSLAIWFNASPLVSRITLYHIALFSSYLSHDLKLSYLFIILFTVDFLFPSIDTLSCSLWIVQT